MYCKMYTAVPPFVEYNIHRINVTRSATTVLYWCWYGPSTVVTLDVRTSSAVLL
jgi:hypothetical protein